MKTREARMKVVVSARIYTGSAWTDATILNMSSRGLMLKIDAELKRGEYVEIRRGTLIIIARVIWVRDGHVGLRAQDEIDIAAIVNEPRLLSRPKALAAGQAGERRQASRVVPASIVQRAERSRAVARASQFIAICTVGIAASIVLVGTVGRFLMGVSATIQAAFHGG